MKIAHITCTFPPYKGGIGNSALVFAKLSQELGHDVTVITPNYQNTELGNKNFTINIKRIKPKLAYGNGAFLGLLINALESFDIVYLHYPFFGVNEALWAHQFSSLKYKLIIHYHMDVARLGLKAEFLRFFSRIVEKSLLNKASIVTCASLDYLSCSSIANYYNKNRDKFLEIPFGVDLDRFYPDYKKDNKIPTILFVGGLDKAHYFKGLEVLMKAIVDVGLPYRLNIVGEGDLKQNYTKKAKKLGLNKKIFFLGSLNNTDLTKVYRESDFFVLPSINSNEAFGLVLLEAMASGLPVIASSLPGVRKVFRDGVDGFLVEPNDTVSLAAAILRMIKDRSKRELMGKTARSYVKEKYTWQKTKDILEEVYSRVNK